MSPKRGELWLVNFNPARGSEQSGIRPALIIQNDVGNRVGTTTIIAAITSSVQDYPICVNIEPNKKNGLQTLSSIKLNQILTISIDRLIKRLGRITLEQISLVNRAIKISLELE
ncbi:MAG: transcriptional modulator [Candidatus Scalindua rubra]|uniref:mRNA interferase n=1 Tax=Candidatus Scalindua rubra TaxID=1872076 RepID=A0A1E3X3D3_9BACT|nr:MAG: transcriptional modulator [Candidatus Scalindua rubra]